MKIRLMNMVKITNPSTGEVLVLDKVKKEGWEGLTFPGGKLEENESFVESVIREAKEETNLEIKNPVFVGIITWYFTKDGEKCKDVGLIYQTEEYSGNLIEENREGRLFWQDYQEFIKEKEKSDSMDDILSIYLGKYSEIFWNLDSGEKRYY
ncbi:MAG: NUDIX domain-containing protein [Peptoniphilaceae bacterium]|nr:NUDIX domain-containing protein [Peptoniphilaceae bacterium]MDY6019039.1 NUDIX domain-containing protein [Anaerococcus sp.]